MGYEEHQRAAGHRSVRVAVLTCSDSRTAETDTSGQMIQRLLEQNEHEIAHYAILRDEPATIRMTVKQLVRQVEVQAIIINGGTGISRRDNTYDVVSELLEKTIPGFGELFRMLSYQTIGSGAMLSRAVAGIISTVTAYSPVKGELGKDHHVIVFSIPGSPNAVELAMTQLILPELSHLVWETLR
jgi:molybdenum cofactor biosynthesis protein B